MHLETPEMHAGVHFRAIVSFLIDPPERLNDPSG